MSAKRYAIIDLRARLIFNAYPERLQILLRIRTSIFYFWRRALLHSSIKGGRPAKKGPN